ncbi:hypothetical protein ACUXAV_002678 [Cupriavidus metallidurans]|jgi:hypothetical protein|uniref:Sodium:proline symporter n=1 Tax=Cupriavidus metallidurans (strain ATCC 43123 / DSM 2839 / NBRC 102507 / CH34) TaxID=266264 RepID=Q1LGA4_CUPMC|nr:membrane protein [Cupriavidus metallidurans]ABF10822.1 conserved hypothetical protein [Cupriavidus metallidurans CH34]AVA34993.1 hypothetical protein C3Z06_16155 [Cupriavidus metallidurans]KWW39688.1 hypothetical protein AU374_00754 [Cupriavidus metallidurans]MDE4920904.1 hypothetical protein [Cupriavidus metallidurans]QGS31724.1 hypothetical protein FOB83_22755 [Cupriavidus metallidurans]
MELHMHSHHYMRRLPDWTAAAVSGLAAGALLIVVEMFWSTMVAGVHPWGTTRMVAAIVLGRDVLQNSFFSVSTVAAALIIHFVLGAILGCVLCAIIAPFQLDSSVGMSLLVGAVFGLVVYMFNFYVMTSAFPWFVDQRGWHTLVGHLIFGMAIAICYWKLESRGVSR